MKKFLLLSIVFCTGVAAYAQKVYFLYLQSENSTPFFVKMADKVYSSTASGYIILPKLVDSTYSLTIGFPGSQAAEATFSIPVSGNDKGLLLRNSDNGINLFDWQTATLYKPAANKETQAGTAEIKADNFTRLLAQAADDASLLTAPVTVKQATAAKPEKKTEPVSQPPSKETVVEKTDDNKVATTTAPAPVVDTQSAISTPPVAVAEKPAATENQPTVTDTAAISNTVSDAASSPATTATTPVEEPAAQENNTPFRRSVIMRKSESSTTEGFGLVYLDNTGAGVDTIRLLIPNPKILFYQSTEVDSESKTNAVKEDTKEQTAAQAAAPVAKAPKVACGAAASESDFFKLRRNMAEKVTDEAMIGEAKKAFRRKCFTTEQIKNLSALFLTPSGKYQFFDAAYLHVSDQEQFKNLQVEIKDDYYRNRFKALVGNL